MVTVVEITLLSLRLIDGKIGCKRLRKFGRINWMAGAWQNYLILHTESN